MIAGLVLGSALAAVAPPAGVPASCAAITDLLGPERACAAAPLGVVIAATAERAAALARIAEAGEQRFARRFAAPPPRYAVVEMRGTVSDPQLDAALRTRGYLWRLSWLSQSVYADALRNSITRAVEAKAKSMGLAPDQSQALVASALSQQAQRLSPAYLDMQEAGSLPHELGHGWFIHRFWPGPMPEASMGRDHYGGPAPDWMDEVAAVMMEDDRLADARRAQFTTIYNGADRAARQRLVDLADFLSGAHPALPEIKPDASAGSVRVLAGEEAARIAAAAGGFYLQARLFADYVLAQRRPRRVPVGGAGLCRR